VKARHADEARLIVNGGGAGDGLDRGILNDVKRVCEYSAVGSGG
jgi:hypothetical protein